MSDNRFLVVFIFFCITFITTNLRLSRRTNIPDFPSNIRKQFPSIFPKHSFGTTSLVSLLSTLRIRCEPRVASPRTVQRQNCQYWEYESSVLPLNLDLPLDP